MSSVSRKSFGGGWSDAKLDALRAYLEAYTKVLKNTPFELVYVDAFAGAGTREVAQEEGGGLFDETMWREEENYRHGSPLIALGNNPPFHRFIFIERDGKSLAKLREEVEAHFPEKMAHVTFLERDANQALSELSEAGWRHKRAVAFLDPFALHVTWETLEAIARTKAIDMWLLFPAMAVNRMLPRSGVVPPAWGEKLTESFGSEEWKNHFLRTDSAPDLFGETRTTKTDGIFDVLSQFITARLGKIFAGVNSKPMILRNSTGAPLFLLCFACGNPRGASIALRIAQHIINKKNHGL